MAWIEKREGKRGVFLKEKVSKKNFIVTTVEKRYRLR